MSRPADAERPSPWVQTKPWTMCPWGLVTVMESNKLQILNSTEEDNLSPFHSKIACLCQSIEINNNKHVFPIATTVRTCHSSTFAAIRVLISKWEQIKFPWNTNYDEKKTFWNSLPFYIGLTNESTQTTPQNLLYAWMTQYFGSSKTQSEQRHGLCEE